MLDVVQHGMAGVLRQWQSDLTPGLAAHAHPCVVPVQIAQAKMHDITRTQSQPGEEQQNGPVA